MSWIAENICEFFKDMIGSAIAYYGDLVNNIFYTTVEWNTENEYVVSSIKFFILLALALIFILVFKQVLSTYILETDGDPDADPFNLVVRIAETVAVISCNAWIFDTTLSLAKSFASDALGSTAQEGIAGKTQELIAIDADQIGSSLMAFIISLVIMLIGFIVFTIIAALRAAEVIAMKMLLPLFALDLLSARRERWNNFITGYFIAFFSYGIQMLFFNIALKSFVSCSWDTPVYIIGTYAFIILAIRAPKFLEKHLYRSGVSGAASGGMRLVAQTMVLKYAR